ncbi:hypothetical protein Gohar_018007, partial [Gossypium harknessii]|nr:hypothetical protein [Gossypium harknessii]
MASEDSTTVSIKLLIDQESNKVIIAEAGSDIVDVLRSLLSFLWETLHDLSANINVSSELSMLVAPNMKETTEKDSKTRVKITLRKSDRKILYGEANEDF